MKFIAHRGYSKQFPENTLEAFRAVIEHPQNGRSLIGIELDIQLCADMRIAVLHDTSLADRFGRSNAVSAVDFDTLQTMVREKGRGKSGPVPDLDQTLQLISHRTELCLEIKEAPYDLVRFTARLAQTLRAYQPRGDIVISSFSIDILGFVMQELSSLTIAYGYLFKKHGAWRAVPQDIRQRLSYLHPHYRLVLDDPSDLLAQPLPLQVWTVDEPRDIRTIMKLIPDRALRSLMTNDIELANQFPEPSNA